MIKLKKVLIEKAITEADSKVAKERVRINVEQSWAELLRKEAEYIKALEDLRQAGNKYAQTYPDKSDEWNMGVGILQQVRDNYLYRANRNKVGGELSKLIKGLK